MFIIVIVISLEHCTVVIGLFKLVSWSLTSLLSTNMVISQMIGLF